MKSRQLTIFILILFLIEERKATSCGKRLVRHNALIQNGFETNEGDWPWHAAISYLVHLDLEYKCGGTLLTSNSVLTAAHCVHEYGRRIIPDKIVVHLGTHNLLLGTHTQRFEVHKIVTHPSYNTQNLSNDIAIIRLSTEATFDDFVQPICLWDSIKLNLSGSSGIVIGWGQTEADHPSHLLREISIPIVEHSTCLSSNSDFFSKFLTDNNFCAGFQNGAGVCNGDSGGSMSFEYNGVYYIRGIVSLTSSRKDKELCNSEGYVVFTDVAQYLPWIDEEVPQPERQPLTPLTSSLVKMETAPHLVEPQPQPEYQLEPSPSLPTHQPQYQPVPSTPLPTYQHQPQYQPEPSTPLPTYQHQPQYQPEPSTPLPLYQPHPELRPQLISTPFENAVSNHLNCSNDIDDDDDNSRQQAENCCNRCKGTIGCYGYAWNGELNGDNKCLLKTGGIYNVDGGTDDEISYINSTSTDSGVSKSGNITTISGSDAVCWWSGCQPDNWDEKGCYPSNQWRQYNSRHCTNGNEYYCCSIGGSL